MKIFYGRLVDTCRRGIWGPIHNHPCTSSILKYLYWPFIQLAYCNVDLIIIIVAVYQLQLYSTHFRLCVCVHDNSKNNGSIDLKLEHIDVYENSSDEFDIGHCPIKVKVTA